ncbi:MAG: VWA domain-containing protein [Spirochaetaceae bacterium]
MIDKRTALIVSALLLLPPGILFGQSLRIGQVDPSRLLTRQEVDLYLGVTTADGGVPGGLNPGDFRVEESPDGETFTDAEVLDITPVADLDEGITFLLLVDNSGSMYQSLRGEDTEDPEAMRITAAKAAIRDFLDQLDHPEDRVALAGFNTDYRLYTPPTTSLETVDEALETIRRPESDQAYTELYRALSLAAEDLGDVVGRKVIVVLSDGEDFPFSVHSGRPHPDYGEQLVDPEAAVTSITQESTGAFAINFATTGDEGLSSIATQTGGLLFDAANQEELASVYGEIRDRILDEYRLTYRPRVIPGRFRTVRVTYLRGETPVPKERRYFTATIMGLPGRGPWFLYLIAFIGALLLAFGTALLRFRNNRRVPNLEVLNPRGKATQVLDITAAKTVIGSSDQADVTLANAPALKESHATIVFDSTTKSYTVVSDEPISVNNQRTSKRRLSPGDVIQLPGSTIVFDTPEEAEDES